MPIKIYFRTRKLQKICSEEREMQRQLGKKCAEKLQQRLNELQAADALLDLSHLPPMRCHELDGNRAGQFSVDIEHPYRLLFIPAHNPTPRRKDGVWTGKKSRKSKSLESSIHIEK